MKTINQFNLKHLHLTNKFWPVLFGTLFYSVISLAVKGGAGDGGGSTCRHLIMYHTDQVADTINNFSDDNEGSKLVNLINANDIVEVETNEKEYPLLFKSNQIHAQCSVLLTNSYWGDLMLESLIYKVIKDKLKLSHEEIHYGEFFKSLPNYLTPDRDAKEIATKKGFTEVSNKCYATVIDAFGVRGDLDFEIIEYKNSKNEKMISAYYTLIDTLFIQDDYLSILNTGLKHLFKTKNEISNLFYNSDLPSKTHKFKIQKLKVNSREHYYTIDSLHSLKCDFEI